MYNKDSVEYRPIGAKNLPRSRLEFGRSFLQPDPRAGFERIQAWQRFVVSPVRHKNDEKSLKRNWRKSGAKWGWGEGVE